MMMRAHTHAHILFNNNRGKWQQKRKKILKHKSAYTTKYNNNKNLILFIFTNFIYVKYTHTRTSVCSSRSCGIRSQLGALYPKSQRYRFPIVPLLRGFVCVCPIDSTWIFPRSLSSIQFKFNFNHHHNNQNT